MAVRTRRQRPSRHEARNRRRGARAREHLEQKRAQERSQLKKRERSRDRARRVTPSSKLPGRAGRSGLFCLGVAAGMLLAAPVQERLGRWTGGELGRIETLAIQGNARLSSEEIAGFIGMPPGSPLGAIDSPAIEARLIEHPWIRAAQTLWLPPATLLVRIEERQPAALLVDPVLGQQREPVGRLVDHTGTAFARSEGTRSSKLPRLAGGQSLASDRPHPVLQTGLALARQLARQLDRQTMDALGEDPRELVLALPVEGAPEGWILRSQDRSFEVVLGNDHVAERLERLAQLLAARLSILRGAPLRIDLRFTDQAVLQSGSPAGRGGELKS
jgi:cell division septal protein FtsQ